jgi:hypothetical protein
MMHIHSISALKFPPLAHSLTQQYLEFKCLWSLYCVYTSKNYYWEFVVIIRRLILVLLVALVPFNNPISNICYKLVNIIDYLKLLLSEFMVVELVYVHLLAIKMPYTKLLDHIV